MLIIITIFFFLQQRKELQYISEDVVTQIMIHLVPPSHVEIRLCGPNSITNDGEWLCAASKVASKKETNYFLSLRKSSSGPPLC